MDNTEYTYENNNLYNSNGHAVMMEWERPWMKKAADTICANGGDILNIGHGLGLVDSYIQEHKPNSHWIIEAHPDVHSHMRETGWYEKANVIESRWQYALDNLPSFDGIYFDTWSDNFIDFKNGLVSKLPYLLNKGGIFSYWRNHSTEDKKMIELCDKLNLNIRYEKFEIDIPKTQHKTNRKGYIDYNLKYVLLPIITNPNERLEARPIII